MSARISLAKKCIRVAQKIMLCHFFIIILQQKLFSGTLTKPIILWLLFLGLASLPPTPTSSAEATKSTHGKEEHDDDDVVY